MDLSDQIMGMSKAFDQYIQGNVENQQAIQKQQALSPIETQQQLDVAKGKQDLEGKVTPDMAESIIPGSSKWVQGFYQQNNRYPTITEAHTGLQEAIEKMTALQGKTDKTPVQHYLGNTPDGKAIFSDNSGNMMTPDKQPYSGVVLPKSSTMPTAQARSTGEFASTIRPHITEMRDMIQEADKKGYIGPASGRIYNQFLAGKVGSTGDPEADRLLGRLRAMDSLLKTGAMKVHFGSRGGQNMYEHFSDMLNSGKQSAAVLNGALDTMDSFMMGYQQAGQPQGVSAPGTAAPAATQDIEAKRAALRAKLRL